MLDAFRIMLTDANTQWVLMGSLLLGIASGVLGSFALLRKQSLIGDAMAHAALPGVCIAFLLYGEKSLPLFLIGAAIAGLIATYCIQAIVKYSRIKEDTSIGLVLSVFFGFGIVLLTKITQSSSGNKSGLDDFIFGQAASLVGQDVKVIMAVSVVLLVVTMLLFKELKLLTFDPQFAQGIGLPVKALNLLLMTLIVGAVVIGIQAVGVILMAAMLITPAIAARYWTERLDRMVIIAGAIGALSGVLGTIISTTTRGLPTGPLIVVAATIMFLISMLFAPQRGLLIKMLKHYRLRKQVARENVLQTLYDLTEEKVKQDVETIIIPTEAISKKRYVAPALLNRTLRRLQEEGVISNCEGKGWFLTKTGLDEAHHITLEHRMREMYVMHETKFATYGLDQEHRHQLRNLPEHIVKELNHLLCQHNREPFLLGMKERVFNEKTFPQEKGVNG